MIPIPTPTVIANAASVSPGSIPLWLYILLFLVATGASALAGFGAMYMAIRRTPFDIKKTESETKIDQSDYTKNVQDIARQATEENRSLRGELSALREEFEAFKTTHSTEIQDLKNRYDKEISELKEAHTVEMAEIKKALVVAKAEAKAWRDYSNRLVSQMMAEMPDLVPVSFEPRKSGKHSINDDTSTD